MNIGCPWDPLAVGTSIKFSVVEDDATLLARVLTLDQREIGGGNYRDIGEFLVELDLDD